MTAGLACMDECRYTDMQGKPWAIKVSYTIPAPIAVFSSSFPPFIFKCIVKINPPSASLSIRSLLSSSFDDCLTAFRYYRGWKRGKEGGEGITKKRIKQGSKANKEGERMRGKADHVCAHNYHAWLFLGLRERHALLETAWASILDQQISSVNRAVCVCVLVCVPVWLTICAYVKRRGITHTW